MAQTQWFLHFLQGPLHPICVTQYRVSVHGHYYHVNGHQIHTLGANLPTEGHMPKPSRGQKDPKVMEALGSTPSHLPSWSPARKPSPGHPNTRDCLGIHITLTEETGAAPPPHHAWVVPLVEDMLCYSRTGLT